MSQIYKPLTSSGPIPPTIATSYTTDNGTAVPAANILLVNGKDSTENNANGIITKGGVAGTGTANEVDIVLTNRLQGTTQTVGVSTANIITFTPTTLGTYSIGFEVAAYNTTSSIGAGYRLFGAVRFDGVSSHLCDTFEAMDEEEGTMSSTGLDVIVSGANVILQATGYAAQTINWGSTGLYTFVGA
jgi:hypothetical protein